MRLTSAWATLALACLTFHPAPLDAQWQAPLGPRGAMLGAPVGSDVERYIRALSIAGIVEPLAWGARPLGPDEAAALLLRADSTRHPWGGTPHSAAAAPLAIGGSALATVNSGFPWGANDGPVWQGRGVTGAVGLAATFRWGPLRGMLAPMAFIAQNASFRLMPTAGADPVMTGLRPTDIDLPQRFGRSSYGQVNAGESSLRLSQGPVTLGVSTQAVGWGVGETFPTILGPNAGGFPHLFAGTSSRGIRIPRIGRVSAQYVLGMLSESRWSPVTPADTFVNVGDAIPSRRVATGLVGSFMPQLLPNLELGISRFYHSPWSRRGAPWSSWSKPLEGVLKEDFGNRNANSYDPTGDPDNQMASIFARWVYPGRGVEANFEYMREDHSWDLRDLAQEPEQNGVISAAVRVVTDQTRERLGLLTLEFFDGDVSQMAQQRPQGLLYFHGTIRQGHTQIGQILGSPIGPGAVAGQRIAYERFDRRGSTSFALQRWRTRSQASFNPEGIFPAMPDRLPKSHDWVIDGTVGITRRVGGRTLSGEAGIAYAGVWQFSSSNANVYLRTSIARF
ncbi:MAG: capsule assembly Wzi family protein [Gemmatimonadota bacterium]